MKKRCIGKKLNIIKVLSLCASSYLRYKNVYTTNVFLDCHIRQLTVIIRIYVRQNTLTLVCCSFKYISSTSIFYATPKPNVSWFCFKTISLRRWKQKRVKYISLRTTQNITEESCTYFTLFKFSIQEIDRLYKNIQSIELLTLKIICCD